MKRTAHVSPCGLYRYALTRRWDDTKPDCIFVMLNPSKADADRDDATITRCINFAKSWECGGITVLNLFAFRATDPKGMLAAHDPIGPENDDVIRQHMARSWGHLAPKSFLYVVAAWGSTGMKRPRIAERAAIVKNMIRENADGKVHCLGLTDDGYPRHPLFLLADTAPQAWIYSLKNQVETT